jgi:hypothetical protein
MVHTKVNAKNQWIDPELIQRASFLYTFFLCFFILMNSHNFNNTAKQILSKRNIAKMEVKSKAALGIAFSTKTVKNNSVNDLDNSMGY